MDAEDLRLAVYRAFAETGRAPRSDELARQLGAAVAPHTEGQTQIGYYPIRPTRSGLAL